MVGALCASMAGCTSSVRWWRRDGSLHLITMVALQQRATAAPTTPPMMPTAESLLAAAAFVASRLSGGEGEGEDKEDEDEGEDDVGIGKGSGGGGNRQAAMGWPEGIGRDTDGGGDASGGDASGGDASGGDASGGDASGDDAGSSPGAGGEDARRQTPELSGGGGGEPGGPPIWHSRPREQGRSISAGHSGQYSPSKAAARQWRPAA